MLIALHIAVLAYAIGNIFTSSKELNVQDIVLAIYAAVLVVSCLGRNRATDESRAPPIGEKREPRIESKEEEKKGRKKRRKDNGVAPWDTGGTPRKRRKRKRKKSLLRDTWNKFPLHCFLSTIHN